MGVPQKWRVFVRENRNLKWMMVLMVWSTLMTQETTMCSPADHLWRVHPVGLVSLRWMGHEAKPNIFPNFIYKLDISSKAGTSQIKT